MMWSKIWLPRGFTGGSVVKNVSNAGVARDTESITGSGRSLGVGHGNLFHYSCLKNSMDRRAWWTMVHGDAKSWTQLSNFLVRFLLIIKDFHVTTQALLN